MFFVLIKTFFNNYVNFSFIILKYLLKLIRNNNIRVISYIRFIITNFINNNNFILFN